MTDLTPERIDELEALANAATEGPWDSDPYEVIDTWGKTVADCTRPNDTAFITESREAVPALIAEVRRLRGELEAQRSTRAKSASS